MIVSSHLSDVDFVPDGHLEKKAWAGAGTTTFNRDPFKRRDYREIETTVASLFTYEHLYFAFWCRYEALNIFAPGQECAEGSELWTRDVIEVFIAPQSGAISHYYEIEISPDNRSLELHIIGQGAQLRREEWVSGCEHAAGIEPAFRLWTVEMRIPLRSMGVANVPRVDWRMNLCRAEGTGSDEQRRLLSWAPLKATIRSFHQPDSFGTLRFATPEGQSTPS